MVTKKQPKKSIPICKVTFTLPRNAVKSAKDIRLVGDFNRWDMNATPMKKQKDGSYSVTLDLDTGHEYQYRYLIDGSRWENDPSADKYVTTPYGDSENSVLSI